MKRLFAVTIILTLSLCYAVTFSQEACKVLMPSIARSYNGTCKKGLADGKGEAEGIDRYTGEFRNGYPDGVGTYVWHSGEVYRGEWKRGLRNGKGELFFKYFDRDSVIAGVWKDDKYVGDRPVQPYVIEYRNGIGRVTCMRIGDTPYVRYKFSRGGEESDNISNLLMQGSSGAERTSNTFAGFERVTFPFSSKVTFNAPNAFMSAIMYCELRFSINEPGAWVVTIYY